MNTYWDYSDKERANLTEDEVRSLLDVELMIKGIKKVVVPILKQIEGVKLDHEIWFRVDDIYFKTIEQAQTFINLEPYNTAYEYTCGYDYRYAKPLSKIITQENLYSHQQLLNMKEILSENKQAQEENDRMTTKYEKDIAEQNRILDTVWEDWWRCKNRQAELQKILNTKSEYLKMTEGNEELAMSFLKKIYTEEDINEALA